MVNKMSLIEKIQTELESENGAEFYAELLKITRAGRVKFADVLAVARKEKRDAREAALAEKRAKQIARAQRIIDGLPNEPREGTKAWQAWQAFDHYGSLDEALPVLLENGHIESTTRVQYSRWKKARNAA